LDVKKREAEGRLVRFVPVETDSDYRDKSGKRLLMQRQWQADKAGRFFSAGLSAGKLKPFLAKARVKLENLELSDEGECIVYRYKSRPLIKLNVKEGQFYSPVAEVEAFGKEAVQQQGHMVLAVLKTNGLSQAVIGKPAVASSARQVLGNLKTYAQDSGKSKNS
jgi:hypothetical protein